MKYLLQTTKHILRVFTYAIFLPQVIELGINFYLLGNHWQMMSCKLNKQLNISPIVLQPKLCFSFFHLSLRSYAGLSQAFTQVNFSSSWGTSSSFGFCGLPFGFLYYNLQFRALLGNLFSYIHTTGPTQQYLQFNSFLVQLVYLICNCIVFSTSHLRLLDQRFFSVSFALFVLI